MENLSSIQPSSLNAGLIASLPQSKRTQILSALSIEDRKALLYDWPFWARPSQLPPEGHWQTWLVLAGRGFGKTRSGGEWVRAEVESGRSSRLALVAPTAADARDVMIEGESGLMNISPPWFRPSYEPSKRRLTWPNGAIATLYSADEPDRLRGPQFDGAWCDELCHWRFPDFAFDMLQFGLRLRDWPRTVITTTPKPLRLLKRIMEAPHTVVTRGSTFENRGNLASGFFDQIISRYQGTKIGRQELDAEILEDAEGALWRREEMIEALRVNSAPELKRIVVAVDPAISSDENSNETGIVIAGIAANGHGYVLDDRSDRVSPHTWATTVVTAYDEFEAHRVVAEINQGGQMVEHTIRTVDRRVAYKGIHASKGKQARAEPVAALYEQGKVHHVGAFPELEDQLCQWVPGSPSPDRLDALVWALTELMLGKERKLAGTIEWD